MATANLHINEFYAKCSKVTGRHPPSSYLVGSKGHESAKIFYADANARYPYRTAGLDAIGCDLVWWLPDWPRPKPHRVRCGYRSPWEGAQQPPVSQFRDAGFACVRIIRGPCLLWPSGWMDQDATWYGDRTVPRRHCGMGHTPPIFGQCILWSNGWMDQDTTWYGGEPRPRRHCVRWGPRSRHGKGHSSFMWFPPYFYSGVSIGDSQKSFIVVFAISCTRFRIFRLVRSCLTLNDARQRYFGFAETGSSF